MDKIATLVKEAEVRGVLAGLADAGHLKIASAEELEAFTEAVSGLLPDTEYDLNDVLNKTAEVLEYLESGEKLEKEAGEAEEIDQTAVMAAFGELSMMKMAGEIDEEAFAKEASRLTAMLEGAKALASKGTQAAKEIGSGSRIKSLMQSGKSTKARIKEFADNEMKPGKNVTDHLRALRKSTAKEVGKTVGLYGSGAAGAALGGKALYDKYKK